MKSSLVHSERGPRLDASGCPLVVPDENAVSAPLVQAIFDENVEAVVRALDLHPELADSVVHHDGLSYRDWHHARHNQMKSIVPSPLRRWKLPVATEPAVFFACRVPELKHIFRYNRKISRESVQIVRLMVDRGATVNHPWRWPKRNWIDEAFGMVCGFYDEPEVLRLLVRAGANPLSKCGHLSFGPRIGAGAFVPLGVAAVCGAIGTVNLLLEYGVPYNDWDPEANQRSLPPLHLAAQLGHADVVAALLEHGAASDLDGGPPLDSCGNDGGRRGQVPLFYAVLTAQVWTDEDRLEPQRAWLRDSDLESRERVVHLLLDSGACPAEQGIYELSETTSSLPLLYGACRWAGSEVVSRFITCSREKIKETFFYNGTGPSGWTRSDFRAGGDGATYLHVAAGHVNTPAMRCLIDSGLQPAADSQGRSALHWLALESQFQVSKLQSLRLKGDPDFPDPMVAAARYLCDSVGIEVHTPDRFGRTALHYAFRSNAYELGIFLLSRGASPAVRDHDGRTPIHYIAEYPWGLENHLADVEKALSQMPSTDIDAQDSNGDTALTMACTRVHYPAVQLILAIGGDANVRDSTSRTPLHCLAERENWRLELVYSDKPFHATEDEEPSRLRRALAAAGADESACNEEGQTAAEVDAAETMRMLKRRAEKEERAREVKELRRLGYGRGELIKHMERRRMAASGPEGQSAGHGRGEPRKTLPS